MRIRNPTDLDKCIREERQLRVFCVLLGLFLFAVSAHLLYKAHGEAVAFITMISSQETSLVFSFAFAAVGGVGFFAAGLSLFVRAIMAGPNQKAIRILSEKITELDNKIKEMSIPTVGDDSEARDKDGTASESAPP